MYFTPVITNIRDHYFEKSPLEFFPPLSLEKILIRFLKYNNNNSNYNNNNNNNIVTTNDLTS